MTSGVQKMEHLKNEKIKYKISHIKLDIIKANKKHIFTLEKLKPAKV